MVKVIRANSKREKNTALERFILQMDHILEAILYMM
jgi:hypothetical protein